MPTDQQIEAVARELWCIASNFEPHHWADVREDIKKGWRNAARWHLQQLQAREQEARRDIRYLLTFVPDWAKEVPEGLCPTMYGTNSAEGDREVKRRVDEIRARQRGEVGSD